MLLWLFSLPLQFADWCMNYGKHGCRTPDTPFSLFEGNIWWHVPPIIPCVCHHLSSWYLRLLQLAHSIISHLYEMKWFTLYSCTGSYRCVLHHCSCKLTVSLSAYRHGGHHLLLGWPSAANESKVPSLWGVNISPQVVLPTHIVENRTRRRPTLSVALTAWKHFISSQ